LSAPVPATLAQKLLGRACGRDDVAPGQSVVCRVDLALLDDAEGPASHAALLRELGSGLWDAGRVVAVLEADGGSAPEFDAGALHRVYRGLGLASLVLAQAAQLRPGRLAVSGAGRDSVAGAFGSLMLGVNPAALLAALTRGELRLTVPQTLFVRWTGRLADGVGAHDMALHLRARLGPEGAAQWLIEFCGEAVGALTMGERMTLAAFARDLGACAGLVAPDQVTARWLDGAGLALDEADLARWRSDEDAPGLRHAFDASSLSPQVAVHEDVAEPGSGRAQALADLDPTPIDVACLGGAEGAKFDDLLAAARVLAGFRIAEGVQLLVAPATRLDRELAAREGVLRHLVEAGATLLPGPRIACRPVSGGTVISSCARPFARAEAAARPQPVLRASPYTVAASALRGQLSDAREVLA
jgi:3-isopropylmalate/(R)-2-methylmalate dehydratase large subunit